MPSTAHACSRGDPCHHLPAAAAAAAADTPRSTAVRSGCWSSRSRCRWASRTSWLHWGPSRLHHTGGAGRCVQGFYGSGLMGFYVSGLRRFYGSGLMGLCVRHYLEACSLEFVIFHVLLIFPPPNTGPLGISSFIFSLCPKLNQCYCL